MKSSLALIVGLVVGLALAAAFFSRRASVPVNTSRDAAAPAATAPDASHASAAAEPDAPATGERAEVTRSSSTTMSSSSADPRFSPELERYARDGITLAWKRIRSQPIPTATLDAGWQRFRDAVLALPDAIGTDLATTANHDDALAAALASSDAFGLLAQIKTSSVGPFQDLVRDAARFEALFACASGGGPVLEGPALTRETNVPDGSELRYPAGVHRVDLSQLADARFPKCLAVRGAGMDRTLLVCETIRARSRVERIEISDATLHAGYLFDLRRELATIVLDRVRIVGFDQGAGSSCAFATAGNALYVRDSRIEGGYGRAPSSGVIFDVRTPALLARFDRCVLSRLAIPARRLYERSTVVFVDCRFDDILEPDATFATPPNGLVFENCSHTSALNDRADRTTTPKRDLNELFPGWEHAR